MTVAVPILFLFVLSLIVRYSIKYNRVFLLFIYLISLYDYTIIPGVIFQRPILVISIVLLLFNIHYLLNSNLISFGSKKNSYILSSFLFVYLFEYIRSVLVNGRIDVNDIMLRNIFLLIMVLSVIIMVSILKKKNEKDIIKKILKPYFLISTVIILTSLFSILLIVLKINGAFNPLPIWMDGLTRNVSMLEGGTRFYSFLTIIVIDAKNTFGIIGGGVFRLCGLSREPHIATFFLTPGILLIDLYVKKMFHKIFLFLSYLLFIILAGSATNYIALFATLLIVYTKYGKIKSLKPQYVFYGIMLILVLLTVFYQNDEIREYVTKRINSISNKGSSGWGASQRALAVFSFKTFLGSGTFININDYIWHIRTFDYGLFPILFSLLHIIIVFKHSLKLFYSNSKYAYLGLGIIYLIIHSLKMGLVQIITVPIYLFLITILHLIVSKNNFKGYLKWTPKTGQMVSVNSA